jgi:hypothetical protein
MNVERINKGGCQKESTPKRQIQKEGKYFARV